MIDTFGGRTFTSQQARDLAQTWIDKIYAAAQPGAVFSAPVVSGAYTIITASEVAAGGGFGFGSGAGPAPGSESASSPASDAPSAAERQAANLQGGGGGGGGGGSSGRPVAAIVIGPDGVKVEPIVDATKIAIAAIGAWLSIALLLVRRARKTS
jgi:uncharacterized spore protein YtfJ